MFCRLTIFYHHRLVNGFCWLQVITVTGYTGAERTLLKNMIFIIGAKYTGYLTRSNTHIICKRYHTVLISFKSLWWPHVYFLYSVWKQKNGHMVHAMATVFQKFFFLVHMTTVLRICKHWSLHCAYLFSIGR